MPQDDRYEDVLLGEGAEKFMLSPLGEKIVELVADDERNAMENLIKYRNDADKAKEAWQTIDFTRGFSGYLQEIIIRGQVALQQLEQENNHDR